MISADPAVRMNVAQDPKTSIDILKDLALDHFIGVRFRVAANPSTPDEIIRALAGDRYSEVVMGAAMNPNASIEMLKDLSEHKNQSVRDYAKVVYQQKTAATTVSKKSSKEK